MQIKSQMNKLIAFLMVIMISACDCNQSNSDINSAKGVDIDAVLSNKAELLPDMCNLVPLEELSDILGVPASSISKINSTPSGENPKQKTCFFKWEDPNFPNSAIMVQAMTNPLGDEYPNYIIEMMNTKRNSGEKTIDSREPNLFTDLQSNADEAIYNTEIGKYFWRFSDKVIFQLAFNTGHDASQQKQIGKKLGDAMIKYYLRD